MRLQINLIALCLGILGLKAHAVEYPCPTDTEYACFDVINNSLCLSQNAVSGSVEVLAACVEYPGAMSDLPGASKVNRSLKSLLVPFSKSGADVVCVHDLALSMHGMPFSKYQRGPCKKVSTAVRIDLKAGIKTKFFEAV
ncbi:hypothetical protein K504DRAFT_52233 [Pleomassaria siparia CBS 279.74]|uniref:Uncharacterized protein n=1 Tax=Pleomassaria siparia CBS 279.74 TaxID=1314801 RepID=A0A6G1K2X8_9PLEO|nr:hypothetical protein K504DRAFT_52233 [Pleomassaria siparia CBS 279.74]